MQLMSEMKYSVTASSLNEVVLNRLSSLFFSSYHTVVFTYTDVLDGVILGIIVGAVVGVVESIGVVVFSDSTI